MYWVQFKSDFSQLRKVEWLMLAVVFVGMVLR